jgi:hypothetical protein
MKGGDQKAHKGEGFAIQRREGGIMNLKSKTYFSLALLAFLFLAANAMAQVTLATFEGAVTDEEGAGLPGAKVDIKNVDTGFAYSTVTRADGSFIISGIEAGKYDVRVAITGFTVATRKGITFNVGSRIRLEFKLATEALKEEITIQAEAPIVEVTKSEISSVVGRKEIDDLPMITRSFAELATTKPGVYSGYGDRDGLRGGGQPSGSSEVLVDGVSNEFGYYNVMRSNLPADAIQEFRVLVNQFGAEYGNATAMVLHAITRSGTNQYRGRAYAFTRNEAFDAKNYFARDLEKEEYTQNRFGGFFGGPIIKDKLHFFLSYEGARHKTYSVITSPLVPRETVPVRSNNNQVLFKLSYQLNEKNMFSFRYTLDYPILRNGGVGGYSTKDLAYDENQHDNVFEGTWVLYTSQNSMNEFRIQYSNRYYETVGNELSGDPNSYQIYRPSGRFGKYWGNPMYWPEKRFQFLDNFNLFLGKHNLKAGFDFNYVDSKVTSMWGSPGMFYFATDEPFDPTKEETYPYRFRWNAAAPSTEWYRLTGIAGYVQDKWQVLPTLTLNIGLRYSNYTFAQNPDQERFETENKYNWDPRIGFSWDPMGDGKTSIRGGVGKYTNSPMGNVIYASVVSRIEYDERILDYPGYPDPFQPNPFRPGGERKIPKENYTFAKGPSPMSMQYTLGAQREILTDFSASVDFVISQGSHLYWFVNKNPIIPGTGDVRPDPDMGNWMDVQAGGHSNYKGMYVTLTKRYAHGWQFELNYTLSKGEADAESGDWNEPSNNEKRYLDYGPVTDDARHRLNITGIVDLPLGFQLSGILYYRSALPYTIVTGNDDNLDGIWNDFPDDLHRNAGRNNDTDFFSLDARLSYFAHIVSSVNLQFFVEAFNLTNRVNFGRPVGDMTSSDFGKPIGAGDPRLIQVGFRVNF